ncbi:MAG TPA: hypothetical protein VMV92_10710 [Streptosporangiaceae bacterium]|nr:hypothetical protein [Streptosporangiaceae bacterium]
MTAGPPGGSGLPVPAGQPGIPGNTGHPGSVSEPAGAAVTVQTRSTAATEATQQAIGKLVSDGVPATLAAFDPALWGPTAAADAAGRLGWLRAPEASRALLPQIAELAERSRADGLDHVVLAGMGGSSLAPEVITRTAGVPLTVLDTTDPHEVARALTDRLERNLRDRGRGIPQLLAAAGTNASGALS